MCSTAADGAAAAALLRREVGGLIAQAAVGEAVDTRSHHAAVLASVQSAAAALDLSSNLQSGGEPAAGAERLAEWPTQKLRAKSLAVTRASDVDDLDVSDLLSYVISCMPSSMGDKGSNRLSTCARTCSVTVQPVGQGGKRQIEVVADGIFSATICVIPSEVAGGDGWGSSAMVWLPTSVSIGPTQEVMAMAHPPNLQVFHDLCARGGVILGGLGRLPAAHRLRPLIRWVASLSGLFQTVCAGCGAVFPPMPISAADLLPPTARCERLLPYHPQCYRVRFGREAEDAFVNAAQ